MTSFTNWKCEFWASLGVEVTNKTNVLEAIIGLPYFSSLPHSGLLSKYAPVNVLATNIGTDTSRFIKFHLILWNYLLLGINFRICGIISESLPMASFVPKCEMTAERACLIV